MLLDILKEKKCFKLVCGAGNKDAKEVEKLVALYSLAGCNFFDINASIEILNAAKKGLEFSKIKKDRYICISVGIKGDPHISKAYVDETKCIHCNLCSEVCLQKAISNGYVKEKKCIGCNKCLKICPKKAIKTIDKLKDLKEILPPLIKEGIDCIEFHTISNDETSIQEKWQEINDLYNGPLSICIDRSNLGNKQLISRLNNMLQIRKPYETIIQADGAPMSGSCDDFKTTLQAVATAEIIQNEKLPVYILLSGGTNSKTTQLSKMCSINAQGVSIGTYARKIVREYIDRDDFFENKTIFNKALTIAKNLVNISLENL